MGIINYALSGNMKKFDEKLKKIAKNEKRSIFDLRVNFLHCFRVTGCGYSDYMNYELYKKTDDELKEYATIKTQDTFYEIVSPTAYREFFTIKPDFLKNFDKYVGRDYYVDSNLDDLKTFLNKHEYFMQKPINGLGGGGVQKVYAKDILALDDYYNKIRDEKLFLEEYVVQHPKISEICSNSVNTIRIMTFGYNGKSEILFACMRFGNGKANVDNFHQGGMAVLVDLDTGKLIGNAFNKNLEYFDEHPESHIKFDGFEIPNWDYIKKMVLDAALVSDKIHVVGWDVAVTKDGAVFIEGNRRPGFDLVQVLSKRGRKDIMRHCLNIINDNEGKNYRI